MCIVPTVALSREYRNDHDFSGLGSPWISVESARTQGICRFFWEHSLKERHTLICSNELFFFNCTRIYIQTCLFTHRFLETQAKITYLLHLASFFLIVPLREFAALFCSNTKPNKLNKLPWKDRDNIKHLCTSFLEIQTRSSTQNANKFHSHILVIFLILHPDILESIYNEHLFLYFFFSSDTCLQSQDMC